MESYLEDRYIRFDWAIKRLLRQKANFGVLEGFLTVFLREKVTIMEILESESNQLTADDKFNRVDIKARNSKDEIIIIEIQNTRELYYLERILYGVAKAITEHISLVLPFAPDTAPSHRTPGGDRCGKCYIASRGTPPPADRCN